MSDATLEIARSASRRSQPTRKDAKQHASADAVLTPPPGCAIDLPTLDHRIPTIIELSHESQGLGCLTDSMLTLATLGSDMPSFDLQQDKTFAQNVILAASHRLQQAIEPIKHSVKLTWWGSALSATEGSNRVEQGDENHFVESNHEKHLGANVVVEFNLLDDGDVYVASQLLTSSEKLAQCESICPGFTHMLYTVLERVNETVWPVFTPRSFWNDARYSDGWFDMTKMSDVDVARYHLTEYSTDDELAEKYGIEDIHTLPADQVVQIYEEEVGGTLPSDFILRFGRAAVGAWGMATHSEHESIPDPSASVEADISSAMASVETRLAWCPTAPLVLKRLAEMHYIANQIANGARFARGGSNFYQPSNNAIHVYRFSERRESDNFTRTLDDVARGAWESGETVDAAGWYCADMSTLDSAAHAVSRLEKGAAVVKATCDLLLNLFTEIPHD